MKISGWGLTPSIESQKIKHANKISWGKSFIAKGNLRSYGDSALSKRHIDMLESDYLISFDEKKGILTAEAGVLLKDIIEIAIPKGWFPPVVPGTKYISLGGAIASDIHGKNHHKDGCFSNFIESITLLLPNNKSVICSKQNNRELFLATCGGMGLTGVILKASIQLKKINSRNIEQKIFKTKNLKETFEIFEKVSNYDYSVAWIDCIKKGRKMGRSVVMTGKFCNDGKLNTIKEKSVNVPFYFPSFLLNSFTIKVFNYLYYSLKRNMTKSIVNYDKFFFPLDSLLNWNRIYGRSGFFQFQFIIPLNSSFEGINYVLENLSRHKVGSFLAVLKLYGKENNNLLSFPMSGYSLALDFKNTESNKRLISSLTDYIIGLNGRVYLAKDSIMTKDQFNKSYKNVSKFKKIRKKYLLDSSFASLQSSRLGL